MAAAALEADLEKVKNLLPSLSLAPGLVILRETVVKYELQLQEAAAFWKNREAAAALAKATVASDGESGGGAGGDGMVVSTTTTTTTLTTTVGGFLGSSSEQQSARIAEQLQPLIQRVENARSLALASAAQQRG